MAEGTLPSKLYFRIGEVADIVGVEPHVLRYWEREFRSIRPTKSARGQRVYSRRDVENLLRVRELLYTQGFTIAGARKQLVRPARDGEVAQPAAAEAPALATAHGQGHGAAPPPVDPPPRQDGEGEGDMRSALVALRDEVAAFLDELGG
ncbi:MAG TPA: MerR family transcriptional regulator [Polyangiaceae bacterium]|nr:MerR family transcriptional regulator [Polyangiaceae bacterium]